MKRFAYGTIVFLMALAFCFPVLANKSAVTIDAPKEAAPGSEITVTVNVTHDGNSFLHYTELVVVKVNGEEVERREYSNFSRPEDENFSVEVKVKVEGDTEIEAEAYCNNHGSAGPARATVKAMKGGM